jgi:hypothetical protein
MIKRYQVQASSLDPIQFSVVESALWSTFSFSVAGNAVPQPKEVRYGRNKVHRS